MDKPVVLVTGCSSGIGREAVRHLAKAGALVVATARRTESIADVARPGEVECLRLDVADDASRAACIAEVLERFGRIDVLVNNAGYGANLTVEEMPPEKLRAMFEVNLFGAHDLMRRVLPAMRARGSGRIVNVSSVAGHIAVPMMGPYCATKFALRALTQSLDNEVRRFGVRAVLVEPAWIATDFGKRVIAEGLDEEAERRSPYANLYAFWRRRRSTPRGPPPAVVAKAIMHASLAQSPKFHNFVPVGAKFMNAGKRLLPDALTSWSLRRYFSR
ncbi:MAG: SDR family oxidoreductase [bacterium]